MNRLRPVIVPGDHNAICQETSDLPHRRAFAGIAVAATAEDQNDLPLDLWPIESKNLLQCVLSRGIINHDRIRLPFRDRRHPPGDAAHGLQSLGHADGVKPLRIAHSYSSQGIVDVEQRRSSEFDSTPAPWCFDLT